MGGLRGERMGLFCIVKIRIVIVYCLLEMK